MIDLSRALRSDGAKLLGVAIALYLMRPSSTVLPSGQVARTPTAPATRDAWFASRLAAARNALQGRVPQAIRESIARDIVAHWIREVGPANATAHARTDEFNFNVGNITAGRAYRGAWFLYPASVTKFRAYASLEQAVTDYLNIVSGPLYRDSWAQLLSAPDDPATWNQMLIAEGYSARNVPDEIARELRDNRAAVDAFAAAH